MLFLNTLVPLPGDLEKDLRKYSNFLYKLLKLQNKPLSLTIGNNQFIQKLNKKYRHINKPTDVLSFALDEDLAGDIIISLPKARQNAKLYRNNLLGELLYLVIHGLCHLQGYDHGTKLETFKMQKAENILIKALAEKNILIKGRI